MPNLSKKELDAIIEEVSSALNGAVTLEAAKLSKAHSGEETSEEVSPDASATTPPSTDSASADASAPPPGPDASASAPPAGPDASASPEDAGAPPAGPDASAPAPDQGGQGADPRELEEAYAALPIEELKMHYLAAKTALVGAMGNSDPGAQMDGAPDTGAPPTDGAAPTADASAGAPAAPVTPPTDASAAPAGAGPEDDKSAPALKTEGNEIASDKKANGENPLHAVNKSEKDKAISSLGNTRATSTDNAIASLSKSEKDKAIESLVNAVQKFVEQPMRKSISSMSDVKPAATNTPIESLSKSEVLTRLKKVAEKPTLTKDDRSAINSYALNLVKVDAVKHLLTP